MEKQHCPQCGKYKPRGKVNQSKGICYACLSNPVKTKTGDYTEKKCKDCGASIEKGYFCTDCKRKRKNENSKRYRLRAGMVIDRRSNNEILATKKERKCMNCGKPFESFNDLRMCQPCKSNWHRYR